MLGNIVTNRFVLLILFFLFNFLLSSCTTYGNTAFSKRSDVRKFIHHVSLAHQFDEKQLINLFEQVHVRDLAVRQTKAPHEHTLAWYQYRAIFLIPSRIDEGVTFWNTYKFALQNAAEQYQVPPQIIVAIIGVETRYGKFLGKYRVIDALATLGFNYPPRARFFQSELEQYLLLTRELKLDPLSLQGSYAGAVGLPQFMPSSYRHLAVSATPGITPDLWHNPEDAIFSVANYFKAKGWQPNQPIAVRAHIVGKKYLRLPPPSLHPEYTLKELAHYGITSTIPLPNQTRANLLILETANGEEYWLAFHNFYVITKYNTSSFYAMAVYQLSEEIRLQKSKNKRA